VHDAYVYTQMGFNKIVSYYGDIGPGHFATYYIDANPANILFDRDGYVRKAALGAIDGTPEPHNSWDRVVKQLCGAP
jgi:hypothetical protein